jgi:hypothetical protein
MIILRWIKQKQKKGGGLFFIGQIQNLKPGLEEYQY